MIEGYFYPVAITPIREFTITMPGEATPFVGTWCEVMQQYQGKTGQVPADGTNTPTPVIFIEDSETAPVLYYSGTEEEQPLSYGGQRPTWPS